MRSVISLETVYWQRFVQNLSKTSGEGKKFQHVRPGIMYEFVMSEMHEK